MSHSAIDSVDSGCHGNQSPGHLRSRDVADDRLWRCSGPKLLGGGKPEPVRRLPPLQNDTEASSSEMNHDHVLAAAADHWNDDVSEAGRPQQPKDADHPSACRLAKRLYHLDGFRKSDVSKHLSKKYEHSLSHSEVVLVTASLFMVLTITYKYQSPISNDINILCCVCFYFVALDVSLGFHFLFCVCYVNPAYGCQIEINCTYVFMQTRACHGLGIMNRGVMF